MKILKRIGIVLVLLIAVLYTIVELRQHRKFDAPYPVITASTDSIVIAKGKALIFGAAHCAGCHGDPALVEKANMGLEVPLSGGRNFDLPIGSIFAPNLTPHATGIANKTDAVIARALRYGVGFDNRALFDLMPFHNTSDEDLTAIISYLRQQPAVENKIPAKNMNLLGKVVQAFLIKPVGPTGGVPATVKKDSTVEYGRYLATSVANCRGCHTNRNLMTGEYTGEDFAGGLKFDTKTDSGTYSLTTPNLTPHATGRITGWRSDEFIARFRAGKGIPESHMPWGAFSTMSDVELKAIYKFLQTVKPVYNEVKFGRIKE
jgi:mono/diheme cytochrome c family protein